MLKIYRAFADHGEIKLQDHIDFKYGEFDTGIVGFGQVKSGNLSCTRANYELQKLKYYKDYLKNINLEDGFVTNFSIFNPYNYEMLENKYKDISKDFDAYEQYGLNEEGILLFTDYVCLEYPLDGSVQRIFGRHPGNGMYLIMPNASFDMSTDMYSKDVIENYEVLQSKSLGKRLVLQKMDRKI